MFRPPYQISVLTLVPNVSDKALAKWNERGVPAFAEPEDLRQLENAVIQYRWITVVMAGAWRASRGEALLDALAAGQAERVGKEIVLRPFTQIEQRNRLGLLMPGQGDHT